MLFRFLLLFVLACTARAASEPAIRFLPEMERIEAVDRWKSVPEKSHADELPRVLAAWEPLSAVVAKKLTAAEVIALSKWAKPQMERYKGLPALDRPAFAPHAISADGTRLVFIATLQTLPSHSPLVTRWLQLYVIYDIPSRSITEVFITIRGEAQE